VALPPALSSVVGWLRDGYPDGVPEREYVPLFALLASRLDRGRGAGDCVELAETRDPASSEAIRTAIRQATDHEPNAADVARVSAHLAAGGWPLRSP
jgi:Protein of unknown function (DUF3349)